MENGLDKLTSREILQMYTRVSEFITFLNKEEKNTEKSQNFNFLYTRYPLYCIKRYE